MLVKRDGEGDNNEGGEGKQGFERNDTLFQIRWHIIFLLNL